LISVGVCWICWVVDDVSDTRNLSDRRTEFSIESNSSESWLVSWFTQNHIKIYQNLTENKCSMMIQNFLVVCDWITHQIIKSGWNIFENVWNHDQSNQPNISMDQTQFQFQFHHRMIQQNVNHLWSKELIKFSILQIFKFLNSNHK
jgi:hypothetical protein